MPDRAQIGRLAIRSVKDEVRAYYALNDTMKGAIWLGTIHRGLAQNERAFEAFISLMREATADIIEERTGHRPTWPHPPRPAPEHERGTVPWKGDA